MADINTLSRLISGFHREVQLESNTLVMLSIKIGGVTNTELTKTILDRLVSLQNGTDVDATYHTHDGRYFTEAELGSATSSSGSDLIGDDNTYSNFTPSAATVKGALAGIDLALASAGGNEFEDNLFRIVDDGDNTKKIAFEASAIATATVRTITMPNANVDLADVNNAVLVNGTRAFTANQPMGGFKITGSADPSAGQDLVTLSYMNARLNGLTPKAPVRVATLVAGTLATSFEAGDTIDGVTLVAGNRILIKNQAAPEQNGIYIVQASGAPVRATDMDSLTPFDEFNGAWTAVQEGTQAGQVWVQYGTVAVVGTDPVNFAYFNPIAGLIGGDMITFAGSTFSVDLATVSGLESTNPGNVAGQLRIKLQASNPSLFITGSNELGVKLDAAGAITSGSNGLIVGVDNTGIEINANALRIKELGVTTTKLADNAVTPSKIGTGSFDQLTITGGNGASATVQNAPKLLLQGTAGEAYAANTTFVIRYALTGETASRFYKATAPTGSINGFFAVGLAMSTSAVSAGGNLNVTAAGLHTLGSSDTPFAGADVGKPVYLTTSGAFSLTAPTTINDAVTRIGIVASTTSIFVQPQFVGIN